MPTTPEIAPGRKLGTIDGALAKKARDYLIPGLRNIHATVNQGKTAVEGQIRRTENYPELQAKLKSHLNEKNLQLQRTEKILTDLDHSASGFKDVAMSAMAAVQSTASAAADDEILKTCFSTFGLANFEAAAYETLVYFAEEAGLSEAVGPLQECLEEERQMAAFLADNMTDIARRFLEMDAEGVKSSH